MTVRIRATVSGVHTVATTTAALKALFDGLTVTATQTLDLQSAVPELTTPVPVTLPAGMSVLDVGTVTGQPTTAGAQTVVINVVDRALNVAVCSFSAVIRDLPVAPPSENWSVADAFTDREASITISTAWWDERAVRNEYQIDGGEWTELPGGLTTGARVIPVPANGVSYAIRLRTIITAGQSDIASEPSAAETVTTTSGGFPDLSAANLTAVEDPDDADTRRIRHTFPSVGTFPSGFVLQLLVWTSADPTGGTWSDLTQTDVNTGRTTVSTFPAGATRWSFIRWRRTSDSTTSPAVGAIPVTLSNVPRAPVGISATETSPGSGLAQIIWQSNPDPVRATTTRSYNINGGAFSNFGGASPQTITVAVGALVRVREANANGTSLVSDPIEVVAAASGTATFSAATYTIGRAA